MNIKLLTEQHLKFLSLKGGCAGSSESTLVKMPHCWKSHVAAHVLRSQLHSHSFSAICQKLVYSVRVKTPLGVYTNQTYFTHGSWYAFSINISSDCFIKEGFFSFVKYLNSSIHLVKVRKGTNIRNRYNQVPHLTQDTNGKVTNS